MCVGRARALVHQCPVFTPWMEPSRPPIASASTHAFTVHLVARLVQDSLQPHSAEKRHEQNTACSLSAPARPQQGSKGCGAAPLGRGGGAPPADPHRGAAPVIRDMAVGPAHLGRQQHPPLNACIFYSERRGNPGTEEWGQKQRRDFKIHTLTVLIKTLTNQSSTAHVRGVPLFV